MSSDPGEVEARVELDELTNTRAVKLAGYYDIRKQKFLGDILYLALNEFWDDLEPKFIDLVREEIAQGSRSTFQKDPLADDPLSTMNRPEGEHWIENEVDSLGDDPEHRCDRCSSADTREVDGHILCNNCENYWKP